MVLVPRCLISQSANVFEKTNAPKGRKNYAFCPPYSGSGVFPPASSSSKKILKSGNYEVQINYAYPPPPLYWDGAKILTHKFFI
jgi:hypothetical protein